MHAVASVRGRVHGPVTVTLAHPRHARLFARPSVVPSATSPTITTTPGFPAPARTHPTLLPSKTPMRASHVGARVLGLTADALHDITRRRGLRSSGWLAGLKHSRHSSTPLATRAHASEGASFFTTGAANERGDVDGREEIGPSRESASGASHPPPRTVHVLTAYELSACPPLSVTPLRLEPKPRARARDAAALGAALWKEVRLAREVRGRVEGAALSGEPFAGDGTELFVAAPAGWAARNAATVLRFGRPGATTAALERNVPSDATLVALDPRPLSLRPADEAGVYTSVLREALYVHAIAVASDDFEVSRRGADGVVLTAKMKMGAGGGRWHRMLCGGAVAALQQFQLTVDASASSREYSKGAAESDEVGHGRFTAQVAVSTSCEVRSALTLRQILDGSRSPNPREGTQVVALGGPHLVGTLGYARDGDGAGTVGEPRAELGGESLLDYHRKRYPARRSLLEHADPGSAAVWLVPKGGTRGAQRRPMAYPAELLAPVTSASQLDAAGAAAAAAMAAGVDAQTLQRCVSEIRTVLGQPFLPLATLSDKMRRLPHPPGTVSSAASGASSSSTSPKPTSRSRSKSRSVALDALRRLDPALLSAMPTTTSPSVCRRAGGMAEGPAVGPQPTRGPARIMIIARAPVPSPPPRGAAEVAVAASEGRRADEAGEALRANVAAGVTAVYAQWGMSKMAADAVSDDLAAADVETLDFSPDPEQPGLEALASASGAARCAEALLRRAASEGYDAVVIDAGGGWMDAAVREAAAAARLPRPRWCGSGDSRNAAADEKKKDTDDLDAARTDRGSNETRATRRSTGSRGKGGDWRRLALELGSLRGGQAVAYPGLAPAGTIFVGVAGSRRLPVCVVDADGIVIAGRKDATAAAPTSPSEAEWGDAAAATSDGDGVTHATTDDSAPDVAAAAAAVRAGIDAAAALNRPPPFRLVIHHDGPSSEAFVDAVAASSASASPRVSAVDVVDVVREPVSSAGRVLSWTKERGTHAPGKGTWWVTSDDAAIAVTTGEEPAVDLGGNGVGKDRERKAEAVPRPLAVRRRSGETSVGDLAKEVVLLAEVGVGGVFGGYALPVSLRGRGVHPAILLL